MRIAPIIEQLTDCKFVTTGGALEFAEAAQVSGRLPAAFVVPQISRAEPSRTIGIHDQRVNFGFDVILIIARSTVRQSVDDAISDFEGRVIAALTGWAHPDSGGKATSFESSALIDIANAAVFWGMRFSTSYHIRKDQA